MKTLSDFIGQKKPSRINVPNTRAQFHTAFSVISESSLRELRALQEEACIRIAERLNYRPRFGETVYFSPDGEGRTTGTVIKVNKQSVTVLPEGEHAPVRVLYCDLLGEPPHKRACRVSSLRSCANA